MADSGQGNKYIPPQLRESGNGSQKYYQKQQNDLNQGQSGYGSYQQQQRNYQGRGGNYNSGGYYNQGQNNYQQNQGSSYYGRGGNNFYGNSSGYGNQRGGGYSQRSYQNQQGGRRGNYNRGGGQYGRREYNSYQQSGPPQVVSFFEYQKEKGNSVENNAAQAQSQSQDESLRGNNSKNRFSNWDARANSRGKGELNKYGYHGSTAESQLEASTLFKESHSTTTGINFDKYDDIPVETSGENVPPPIESFVDEVAKKMIPESLQKNLERCGFKKPTPVQKYALPIGMGNRDMMACAQTGSGKTGGFLFPMISQLLRNGAMVPDFKVRGNGRTYSKTGYPNALILAPTRELVMQIFVEAQKFSYATGLRPVVVYGGADSRGQRNEIQNGVDVLVATPGRLIDFIERGDISLCCVQYLTLDEADRMLDMGFEPSIRKIVHELDMPPSSKRRTFMFSATFPPLIQKMAQDFMEDYVFVTVGRVGSAAKDILQTVEMVPEHQKRDSLMQILNGISDGLVLVFTQTKRGAEDLQWYLVNQGFAVASIHGDRSQYEREQALNAFKTGQAPILVATDVAARGLDIDNVTFVINFDLPSNIDDYVHRIGRTGRAGNKGTAVSFFNDNNINIARQLLQLLEENNQDVPSWLTSYGRGGSMGPRRGGRGRNNNTRDYRQNFRQSKANDNYGQRNNNYNSGNNRSYNSGASSYKTTSKVADAW